MSNTKKVSVEQFSEIYSSLSIKNRSKLVEYAEELKKGLDTYSVMGYTEYEFDLGEPDEESDKFVYGITTRIKILLEHETERFTLTLIEEVGSCPSGYCAASYGRVESFVKEDFIPEFIANHAYQIKFPEFDPDMDPDSDSHITNKDTYKCDQFRWSLDAGDQWYPSGYVIITKEMFKPNAIYNKESETESKIVVNI